MLENVLDKTNSIHRDLSWLLFNKRVLDEALDMNNPLLERVKFLAIFVNNLDEFFMVRVASLRNFIDSGMNKKDAFGFYPQELYDAIKNASAQQIDKLYDIYEKDITKQLEKNDIFIKKYDQLTKAEKKAAEDYFETTLYPIVTPLAVDPGHPFPILPSKTLAFAVSVSRKGNNYLTVIPVPKNVNRLFKLPSVKNETNFILIDDILRAQIKSFFQGYKVSSFCLFRVIRDSELILDEEVNPSLLKAIEEEVKKRFRAKPVYMEIEEKHERGLLELLCDGLKFPIEEVNRIKSDLDLSFFFELMPQVEKPALLFPSYAPAKINYENIFQKISEGDFIGHLPFQSFYPTVDLVESAAKDKNVLAIKMTLYRTNKDSAIVEALKEAAQNKKQVTVLIEIKARFDEENNIKWVRELEEAGCHVIYGIPGLKVHSKMTLIVRKEDGQIKRYAHLSTGNYNQNTSKVYTDIGYFSCNEDLAKDISDMFNVVTGYSNPSKWKRIISAPNDLREYFLLLIDKEIQHQKKTKNGLIRAKFNSLEDPEIILKLYEASKAGVKIKLLVRGICCLIPGVKGLSENIEVRSLVGRFLEHSRVYLFNNNGSPRIFLSSADWMRRNFDKRVEVLFEIYKEEIKDHLKQNMDIYWKDTVKARELLSDGNYQRHTGADSFNAQEFFITSYAKT